MLRKPEIFQYLEAMKALLGSGDEASFQVQFLDLAKNLHLTEAIPQSLWDPAKRRFVLSSLIATEGTAGDVVELGVYRGGGTFLLAQALQMLKSRRRVLAVDSFEGLPAPSPQDRVDHLKEHHYIQGMFADASDVSLRFLLEVFGLAERVSVVKGFFEDVLPAAVGPEERFSLVIVDPDQYEGTRFCLEFFYPRLSPGAMMLIDDYQGVLSPGVTRAVTEFLADKPETAALGAEKMCGFTRL